MYNKIYLHSRDWGGNKGPEVIGVLTKDGDAYTFKYADQDTSKHYKVIKPFTDKTKTYGTEDCLKLINRVIPIESTNIYVPDYLKLYRMETYDMWELLIRFIQDSHLSFGRSDCTNNVFWAIKPSTY